MADVFENHQVGLTCPATHCDAITPSDTQPLANTSRILYVGSSGDISVMLASGDTATLTAAQSGVMYPLRVTRVYATGTTATNLLGLY